MIDLDGDGIDEIIIMDYDVENLDKIVLRYHEGVVYSYEFSFRAMDNVRKDGSFSWNGYSNVGHEYGTARLSFTGNEYEWIELDKCVNDGEENAEYYINGESVTQEAFAAYVANQNAPDKVEWLELNNDNLNKYLT